jgi:hypothetical protein
MGRVELPRPDGGEKDWPQGHIVAVVRLLAVAVVTTLALACVPPAVHATEAELFAAFHDAQQSCDQIAWVDRNHMARPTGYDAEKEKATLQARLERQADAFRGPAGIRFLRRESEVADDGIRECARRLLAIVAATPTH